MLGCVRVRVCCIAELVLLRPVVGLVHGGVCVREGVYGESVCVCSQGEVVCVCVCVA